MTRRDHYYNKSKQEGYRSRAAYKLRQLDDQLSVIQPGNTVVDLGAAPGGWLQVAGERVGDAGRVVGVDLQRIDALDDEPGASADVATVRGDMTDEDTRDEVRAVAGDEVDVVVSDMAPNMTGEYSVDHARSVHLARQAFETALDLLRGGGNLVVKVFEGPDLDGFRQDVEREFDDVWVTSPDASREASSEVYVVAKGRLTAPVREGDELTVEIEDVGSEGDGVAKVEGFTLFVPDTEAGDTVDVRVTDVRPRFAFAEHVD
jgi:23S rRNA (uridine2552-2'-O)-methyltransferase